MSDLLNGWPEDGEPVLTMSDDEVVRWIIHILVEGTKMIEHSIQTNRVTIDVLEEGIDIT